MSNQNETNLKTGRRLGAAHGSAIGRRMIQDTIASCAGTASILSETDPKAKSAIRLCNSTAKALRKLSPNVPDQRPAAKTP